MEVCCASVSSVTGEHAVWNFWKHVSCIALLIFVWWLTKFDLMLL